MDTRSLAHPSRTVYVDQRLCEEIAELTGISYRTLYLAFVGEQKNLALDVVKTAVARDPQGRQRTGSGTCSRGLRRVVCGSSTDPATGTVTRIPTSTTLFFGV